MLGEVEALAVEEQLLEDGEQRQLWSAWVSTCIAACPMSRMSRRRVSAFWPQRAQ